jgi:hypothetical protein
MAALMLAACAVQAAGPPVISNPGFEETVVKPADDPEMLKLANIGWKFLEQPVVWPVGWNAAQVSNITFGISRDNPHSGQQCLQLWGESGSSGYINARVTGLKAGLYKMSFYGRGTGKATLMTPGIHIILNRPMRATWARYSGIFRNTSGAAETSITLQAHGKPVWFDDITIEACDVLEAKRVMEEAQLAAAGKLLDESAKVDQHAYAQHLSAIQHALPRLQTLAAADPIPANVETIKLLAVRLEALQRSTAPTVDEMNAAICYRTISEQLLQELDFVDAEEGR